MNKVAMVAETEIIHEFRNRCIALESTSLVVRKRTNRGRQDRGVINRNEETGEMVIM